MKITYKIKLLFVLLAIGLLFSTCKKDPILIPVVPEGECPFTCLNGGTCIESTGLCDCPPEYTGAQCQFPVDPCATVICLNGGVCINGLCDCPEGWTGANCSTPGERIITFLPSPITDICPLHIAGNMDFQNKGPAANIELSTYIVNSEEIHLKVIFELEQTSGSSITIGYIEMDEKIYTAPPGSRLTGIKSNAACDTNYTDDDDLIDILDMPSGSLADRFEVMGDTPGNDLDDCNTGSRLDVYFNVMEIGLIDE